MHCGASVQGGRGAESNKKAVLQFVLTNYIYVSILDGLERGGILNWDQIQICKY